jgi:hypothetical protein
MSLGPGATGHHPVVSPPCEPVSFVPHLLIEGGQQDVAQQRRDYALNAKDNFRFERTIVGWRSGDVLDLRRKR